MLLAALGERRPTADVDLLALQTDKHVTTALAIVREVLSVVCDDGAKFDLGTMRASAIREDAVYSGVRVVVPARVDRARCALRVDMNVGDPVTPAPTLVTYPSLLGKPYSLNGYPLETVLAEKLVTMLDRGELTTRERDFADVLLLIGRHGVASGSLGVAIDATASCRGSERRSLRTALGDLGSRPQRDWTRYLERAGLEAVLPDDYEVAIGRIVAFAENVLLGMLHDVVWDSAERTRR